MTRVLNWIRLKIRTFLNLEAEAKSIAGVLENHATKLRQVDAATRNILADLDAWIGALTPPERALLAEKLRKRRSNNGDAAAVLDRINEADDRKAAATPVRPMGIVRG